MKKATTILLGATLTLTLASCDLYGKKDFEKFAEKTEKIDDVTYTKAVVKVKDIANNVDYKVNLVSSKSILGIPTWSQASDDKASKTQAATAVLYVSVRVNSYASTEVDDVTYYSGLFGGFKVTSEDAKYEFNKYGYLVKVVDEDDIKVTITYKK